ncbi:MAG: hypothetical protein HY293_03835 [Planctomycetes bacterium]|nr:hypothetical protein [Planctomycetota bacterium]
MRAAAKVLLLASLLALRPACGGGRAAIFIPVPAPLLPAGNAPGTTFPALSPTPLGGTPTTIDATNPRSDAQVAADLQAALTAGGSINFTTTGGGTRTIVLAAQLVLPAFGSAIVDGGNLITLSGGGAVRILLKQYQSTLTVQQLAFIDASAGPGSGAAINVEDWDGRLTVIDCSFSNCSASPTGPDIGGGAIRATGQRHFQVSGCTFTNCRGSNGGALNSLGCQLSVINSSFTGCSATGGAGGSGGIGGAIYIDGVDQNADLAQLVVSRCTFTTNTANNHAGAIFGYTRPEVVSTSYIDATSFNGNTVTAGLGFAGAVYSQNGTLTLANSTFNGNQATSLGGGLWFHTAHGVSMSNCTFTANHTDTLGGAMSISGGLISIVNCTITGNSAADFGGGIFSGGPQPATVTNTVLSNNTATDPFNGHNTSNTFADGGGNFQWPNPGGGVGTPITAGVTFADPLLQPLANNGGPTFTMALGIGSPAINGGVAAGATQLDQRGVTRSMPDSGAFEN